MKTAIDTNILIRLLTADNKSLLQKAERLISNHSTNEIFIAYGVILETYFVLKSFYKWENGVILDALQHILNADEFHVEHEAALHLAITKARKDQSFYDAVIGEVGAVRNLKTYTFDKRLKKNSILI